MHCSMGISIGGTNLAFVVEQDRKLFVLQFESGSSALPSVVALTESDDRIFGLAAKRQTWINPQRTVHPTRDFTNWRLNPQLGTPGEYYLQDLVDLLNYAKNYAEESFGNIVCCVCAVPPSYVEQERIAVKNCLEKVGLQPLRIIDDSIAAALTHRLLEPDSIIMVVDVGGTSVRCSLLVGDGYSFERLSHAGEEQCGGEVVTQSIVTYLSTSFADRHGIDPRENPVALQRLNDAAEIAKIELSRTDSALIWLPNISGSLHLEYRLSRSELDSMSAPLIDRVRQLMERGVAQAKSSFADLSDVILSGGGSEMPAVQHAIRDLCGRPFQKRHVAAESAAHGAAVQSDYLAHKIWTTEAWSPPTL